MYTQAYTHTWNVSQEEAQLTPTGGKGGSSLAARSLGYAHTHDVGGVLGGHCALLLKTFKVCVGWLLRWWLSL